MVEFWSTIEPVEKYAKCIRGETEKIYKANRKY